MRRALLLGSLVAGSMACGSSFDSAAPDAAAGQMDTPDAGASPESDATTEAAGDAGNASGTSDGSADAAPILVAQANGTVDYLAANGETVGWIESGNLLRFASATATTSATAGATAGVSVSGVTAFAMNDDYAYVGADGQFPSTLEAFDFTSPTPAYHADFAAVSYLATVADQSVWDIANNSIETFPTNLTTGDGSGDGTGISASQLIAAGAYLYYNMSNTIIACSAASCKSDTHRLFTVPSGVVLYAANSDSNNANVFSFDADGQMSGCPFNPDVDSNGCKTPIPIAKASDPGGIATDGDYVYWIDLSGTPGIYREAITPASSDGGGFGHGDPELIAPGDTSTANLTLNSKSVFWSTANGTSTRAIYRLPQAP